MTRRERNVAQHEAFRHLWTDKPPGGGGDTMAGGRRPGGWDGKFPTLLKSDVD